MIRILHLTDFHLNERTLNDWNGFLGDAFFTKVSKLQEDKKIDLVLFTGDLLDKGGADFGGPITAFEKFKENIIIPIIEKLEIDISRFIICPGNHDIDRNADKSFLESGLKNELKTTEKINQFIGVDKDDYDGINRIKDYKNFEYDLYRNVEEKLHSKFEFSIKLNIEGQSVGISSLNSSWRCYGENDLNNILLGEKQLNDNFLFVKDCDVKIALMHHQLNWLSDIEAKIIKNHISNDYDLIFSGHVHETNVEVVQNLAGQSCRIVSPSGLNKIRENEVDYINGFTIIDYGEDMKCHFLKYNKNLKIFVDNTDACENGLIEFTLKGLVDLNQKKNIYNLVDEDFL